MKEGVNLICYKSVSANVLQLLRAAVKRLQAVSDDTLCQHVDNMCSLSSHWVGDVKNA